MVHTMEVARGVSRLVTPRLHDPVSCKDNKKQDEIQPKFRALLCFTSTLYPIGLRV